MSERKSIAICVTGHSIECDSKIVAGIRNRCSELGINSLVFSAPIRRSSIESVMSKTSAEQLIRGENEIFNLINYKKIAGVIVLGETFSYTETIYKIAAKCKKFNVPIININDPDHELQNNVLIQNCDEIGHLVEHLVYDHKCKRINFIGGVENDVHSTERLNIFLNAMKKCGMEVEPSQIGYGYYWDKAAEVTKNFMSAEKKPDAIICANDVMAIFSMEYLKDHGYKIPEDIIVTGYDGVRDAFTYEPSITTIQPKFYEAGVKAVDILLDANTSEPNITVDVGTALIKQASCGCKPLNQKKAKTGYLDGLFGIKKTYGFFTRNILGIYNNASMAESIEELCGALMQGTWSFGFKRLSICLNRDFEKGEVSLYNTSDITKEYNGLSDRMICMYSDKNGLAAGTVFSSSDLLPENVYDNGEHYDMNFAPLHFKDKFLGYVSYVLGDNGDFQGEQFSVWMMTAANEIGTFYSIRELESLYSKDPLTGLNNRLGMKKAFARMFPKDMDMMDSPKGYFTTVCADIDYLKPINDKFGHEAGDNAIVNIANAIKFGFPKDAVCVRTGGDEFCVLLQSKSKPNIERYIAKVEDYLDRFNEESNLPYKIFCSLGYYTVPASEVTTLPALQKIADRKLYEIKEIHHGHKY